MKFNTEELLKLGLLRKIPKAKDKAVESVKTARAWIEEAENNLKSNALKSCIISSYNAMFHVARAFLFADGFREKSHFAVARYLEDKYTKKGFLEEKWIMLLDFYRENRHASQYSTSFITTKEEAEKSLKTAREFVERMKRLLKKEHET